MVKFYNFFGPRSELTDVYDAARIPKFVKNVIDDEEKHYFYVVPWRGKKADLIALWFLFRRNGVILTPHKSGYYNSIVLRCRDKRQKFMRDVCEINRNPSAYTEWLRRYHEAHK